MPPSRLTIYRQAPFLGGYSTKWYYLFWPDMRLVAESQPLGLAPLDQEPLCSVQTVYSREVALDVLKVHSRTRISRRLSPSKGQQGLSPVVLAFPVRWQDLGRGCRAHLEKRSSPALHFLGPFLPEHIPSGQGEALSECLLPFCGQNVIWGCSLPLSSAWQ